MRSSRSILAILFAALGPTACGSCDDKPTTGATDAGSAALTTDAAPTASASASAGMGRRGMAMRGAPGPVGMLVHTAKGLELKDEQKTKLDAAEKSLKGDEASSRDEMKALHTDLAASVKAGKLDQAKIDADLAAIEKAAKDRNDKEAAALNDIYAALEPAQRVDVAKKVRERTEAREKKDSERRAKMAERDKERGDGGADGGRGDRNEFSAQRRVERLVRDLDLDAEQQKKAQALAKDDPKAPTLETARADAKKRGEALLAAFEKDGFDAKKLEAPDTKRARQGAEQEVKLVSSLLPILKPEQREKLAARMEKQAQGGGAWGGPGGRGGPGGPHGGMAGMAGMGGPGGHRRTLNKHQTFGPDYDWFDDDEEEEMGAGGAGGSAAAAVSASAAPAASASAPAK
jgi:Spy/CpxP family protein refolding chaperone